MGKIDKYILIFNKDKEMWAAVPKSKQEAYFKGYKRGEDTGILYAKDATTLINFLK